MGGPQRQNMLPTKTGDIAFYNSLGNQTLNIYGIRLVAFNIPI